jgi:MFS family permease
MIETSASATLLSPGVYRWYVLGILTVVYTLNYVDQGLMGLLLQPIKVDLKLSDSQLGFLTGIAFALFYATLGLPIARWADRGNRATITSLAIGIWGITVMLSLPVANFYQLLAARVAAGVGESGCVPPTYSLVGDYFPAPADRTRAMTVYMLASPLAALLSFIGGGWLNELYGWRMTFFLMGVPGLLMAALVKLTIAEPRGSSLARGTATRTLPPVHTVLTALWHQRSTRNLVIGLILLLTMGSGIGSWNVAFMMRSHHMNTAQLGLWLGPIFGIGGLVGTLLGGYVSSRWYGGNERGQMRLSAASIACLVPFYMLFLLAPQRWVALAALVPIIIASNFFIGPTFALLQRLVPNDMRATSLSIVMLLGNLIGLGVGPQVVGLGSDLLSPHVGSDSLRYALLAMSFVAFATGYYFWKVGASVAADLQAPPHRIGR